MIDLTGPKYIWWTCEIWAPCPSAPSVKKTERIGIHPAYFWHLHLGELTRGLGEPFSSVIAQELSATVTSIDIHGDHAWDQVGWFPYQVYQLDLAVSEDRNIPPSRICVSVPEVSLETGIKGVHVKQFLPTGPHPNIQSGSWWHNGTVLLGPNRTQISQCTKTRSTKSWKALQSVCLEYSAFFLCVLLIIVQFLSLSRSILPFP